MEPISDIDEDNIELLSSDVMFSSRSKERIEFLEKKYKQVELGNAVGYDLYGFIPKEKDHTFLIDTELKVFFPEGYFGMIVGRSSTARRHGILVLPGVIDPDYTGDLQISCIPINSSQKIEIGENELVAVAQLLVIPCYPRKYNFMDIDTFRFATNFRYEDKNPRKEKGFGSTG